MKNTLLLLLTCLMMTSCKMYFPGKMPVRPTPFVQTETGTRISANKVEKTKKEIIADGQVYKPKDVSFYSDGKVTYARIGGTTFAPRIAEGKLNLYQWESQSTRYEPAYGGIPGRFKTTNHRKWYIQDSGSNSVVYYGYKSLNSLIPANSPAGELLKNYKTARRKSNILLGAGFGMFILGAYMGGDAILKDKSDAKVNAGLYTILAGAGVMTYAMTIRWKHSGTLIRAFNRNNGLLMPD